LLELSTLLIVAPPDYEVQRAHSQEKGFRSLLFVCAPEQCMAREVLVNSLILLRLVAVALHCVFSPFRCLSALYKEVLVHTSPAQANYRCSHVGTWVYGAPWTAVTWRHMSWNPVHVSWY
jgi:hypothetical protein